MPTLAYGNLSINNFCGSRIVVYDYATKSVTSNEGGCGHGSDSSVASAGERWCYLLRISELRPVRRTRAGDARHPADLCPGRNGPLPLADTETIPRPAI